MMEPWKIRSAVSADAKALALCMGAAYAEQAVQIPDLPVLSVDYADEIERYPVWVADAGTMIAGGLVLVPGKEFMMLANVAVHPDFRGTGLGRTLLSLAEEQARGKGYRELRLKTHVKMPDNVELYRRLGWLELERSHNAVSMRKSV